ncbi:MAG: cupin domain-containing protein [Gemmatimonadota bacterium]|nr:cupin domain-containing protein [Gemmatimonadota bacterium]
MERIDVSDPGGFFDIVAGTSRSQAATMVLQPGKTTGGPENRHEDADQWLYVARGSGTATVAGERVEIASGDLLLIEAGETHEIRAGEEGPLVTVNVYAPPAY